MKYSILSRFLMLMSILAVALGCCTRALAVAPSPCTLPGVQILTVPAGDSDPGPFAPAPNPPTYDQNTQDIQAIYFAELASTPDKITYTMKVGNLNTIPANGSWRIRWDAPDGSTYFVSMDTDQNSKATFSYGTYSGTTGYSGNGSADSGTYSADGTITITNSNSKTGSPKPGQQLKNVFGETDLLVGTSTTGGLLQTADDTSNATPSNPSYTLLGNIFCGPASNGGRTATYVHGGITFSPNCPNEAPTTTADSEPSSRVDGQGNFYIMPIRGVPGGVDLFYYNLQTGSSTFDPNMRALLYLGQPDSPTSVAGQNQLSAGALGGGDIDVALGFGNYPGDGGGVNAAPNPVLGYASLLVANVTVGRSLDKGHTFQFNALGNFLGGAPVNDRQWMGFFGPSTVYLVYRNFAQGIAFIQQSTNGGLTYGPAFPAGGIAFPQTGALDVDQTTGIVYVSSNDGHIAVGDPANNTIPGTTAPGNAPTTYNVYAAVPAGVDTANIFFPIRVATVNHTVYGVYSDGHDIYLVSSADKGVTWKPPVRVNDPTGDSLEKTNVMPWLAVGPTAGSVGIVWYGTDDVTNDNAANWRVFYAQTTSGDSDSPSFRIAQASDHVIHASNISLKGLVLLGAAPNRNLSDYFQVNFDPQGAAVIGYTDDHIDFRGISYVTRQVTGLSVNGGTLGPQVEGASLPAQPYAIPGTIGNPPLQPMQPGPNGEQVTDFAQDQDSGLLAVTPTNSPIDIISIKYASQTIPQGSYITATMQVSDLTTVPNSAAWRMYFAANAPDTGIIGPPGNQYSKGIPDRGDYFYVDMTTDAQGNRTFNWGIVTRNTDGSTTDTRVGTADSGFVNQLTKTITVRISVNTLNARLGSLGHPLIATGSVMCGLRGTSHITDPAGQNISLEDFTRGGTEFTVTSSP
jgi:hypothetical protein